jgi:VanZ family protein
MHWIGALGTGLYCGLIFLLSSQPLQVNEELKIPGLDKVVHMGIYGALALIVSWGLRHARRPHGTVVQFWAPIAFALLYGISDEWHQSLVPLREFDPWDLVADTAGAVVAQVAVCCWWWGIPLRATIAGRK